MFRRWLAWVVGLSVVAVAGSFLISYLTQWPAAKAIQQPGPIIVISEPALAWDQVSPERTPNLWRLARDGASGSLTTRSLSSHSCDYQSWLTFGAAKRTSYGPVVAMTPPGKRPARCPGPPYPALLAATPATGAGAPAIYTNWAKLRTRTLSRSVPADPSNLTTRLTRAGQCITAAGRYAPLAAATSTGRVEHYVADPSTVDLTSCPVTFVSLAKRDDAQLGRLLARAPADATIVVAGFADGKGPELLHTVVVSGPGVPHGLLTSYSTQQPGVVQLTDLSAFVLARLGAAAPQLPEGRSPMVQPRPTGTSAITDASMVAMQLQVEHALSGDFLTRYVVTMAVLLGAGGVWWLVRRRRARAGQPVGSGTLLRWFVSGSAALTASMPVSTWLIGLVPWWNAANPRTALAWGIVGFAALIAALALLGPWRRHPVGPPVFVATVTLSVLLLDVIHGTPLQFVSVMGLQPVYGGRFYGMGNVGDSLMATSALLIAALLAGVLRGKGNPRLAAATVILIGLATLVIDGTPTWGADGGGPLAMFPAFAYLALNAGGLALTWRRAALICGTAVGVVGVFAVLDYLRPPKYRTHLGDFVAQIRWHRNFSGLEPIVTANWNMLSSNVLTAIVPLILLLSFAVMLTPNHWPGRLLMPLVRRVPLLGEGIAAIVVFWFIGFVSNDSGVSIPPTGLLLLAPLLIVLAASPTATPYIRERLRGTLAHPRTREDPAADSE
ncbi:hypothetical protein [Flexivirga caeni]|uniref:Uncharacterized protein n=1 Tax=Flexivirga caeni TaxID=2294115 RepID=A0A3M9MIX9_9MICO|nr:hypothetical protein [Flexivirga caeni]RNI25456.1 hypothetical protein EFY87_02225 [Flexivirga caeni]